MRFSTGLLWIVTLLGISAATATAADRPNILWLVAEDLGPHLGCYGTRQVWTPNLDRLAAEGVRYENFFTTGPVCSPSRSAFMTGMYQTTIGVHNHRSHRDDGRGLPDGVRVLTDWLRGAGYFTSNLRRLPAAMGFAGTGKTDWNFLYEGQPFDSDKWDDLKGHQPFYAQLNFQETHRGNRKKLGRAFPAPKRADPAKVEIPPYYPDHPITREDWANYLDAASELDRKVGLVLRQLEADGLAQNTIVVFFGDNGQAHVRGKQFCYDSGLHVPLVIRWPKNSAPPAHFRPGTVDGRLLAAIDLAPTMLAIAGNAKPEKMQGEIFLGDHAGRPREYVFGARDRCDETPASLRTVRDARWRYIRNFMPERPLLAPNEYKEAQYPVWNLIKKLHAEGKLDPVQEFLAAPHMPAEELYDIQADPHETRNLVGSSEPEHRAALERLRGVLGQWILDSDDQGRFAESPAVISAEGLTKPGGKPGAQAIRPKPEKKPGSKVLPNSSPLTPDPSPARGEGSRGGHPFAVVDYSQGKALIVSAEGKVEWEYPAPNSDDLWVLPNGNLLFNTGHGVKEVNRQKQVVFSYESKSEVYACQRLANGNTFIGECSAGRLLEVDPKGKVVFQLRLLPEGKDGGHAYMRNARCLADGHYLVCLYGAEVVREYDRQGKVVREIRAEGGPHSVVRLPNGNTLVACGDKRKSARVFEVDPSGKTVWQITADELPGIRLAFMAGLQRLPNGNTVLSNWLGHGQFGRGPHLIEVTPDKRVVWTFADHRTMRTVSSVQLLDVPGDATRGEILH